MTAGIIQLSESQKELRKLLRKSRYVFVYCRVGKTRIQALRVTKREVRESILHEHIELDPKGFKMSERGNLYIGEIWR